MSDEQQPSAPRIRDPHAPANLVDDFEPLPPVAPSAPGVPAPVPPVPPAPRPGAVPAVGSAPSSLEDVADYDNAGDMAAALGVRPTFDAGSESSGPSALFPDDGDGSAAGPRSRRAARADEDALLAVRPRISSRVLCVVFGLLFVAAAFGVWWFAVYTETGQSLDDMAETSFRAVASSGFGWLAAGTHAVVAAGSAVLAVAAAVVAGVRRRWWLLGQLAVFGVLCAGLAELKHVLPRPFIIHTDITDGSSAPSGHVVLAVAAALALVCAVSRGWRWAASLLAMAWTWFAALSVVYGQWHRPSDAAMAVLLIGGVAMLALAFTRTSGMDRPGQRRSSAGVQVLSSVTVTAGVMACLYASYVIWQVTPGLTMGAQWAKAGAVWGSVILLTGVTLLTVGLVAALRQLTAAPLTRLGLVGAPPAPPARGARRAAGRQS
ncbi:phosphatase PAP2 family protein [Bifidobacterium saguinibicoloris]|uniref:phosphatase PAP2 family protein n=1 Tax=Bifidobacterium saguinibicoloris TaxID=2834433 RepID=UPI001C581E66|nr:phosphatase PAP2 family protein [Bifidobacterium saguinibicoloris]MBW3080310.1 phosphatase PAP2 family protein [Bifidobacterium saguinibicoloris]